MKNLLISALTAALLATPAVAQQVAAKPGPAVTKFDGASHQQYFGDPMEWARFQELVTTEEFREIRQGTEKDTRTRLEGGYLVLTGCLVRACTTTRAGLAVHVETGQAMAVIWQRDREPRIFNAQSVQLPVSLTDLAENGTL
ncbi:MAG: hypothetical protein AAGC81_13635 [Pseudomonadota bacterium]